MANAAQILVIKHSAFGDFILSTGSFKAIRAHHAHDRITLLTSAAYRPLGEACPFFDAVWVDPRPTWRRPDRWIAMVRRLRGAGFDRVYDLQRNDRTAGYFRALWPNRPEWVGVVAGCSHRYAKPADRALHIVDREAAQLAVAEVRTEPAPDLSWLGAAAVPPALASDAVRAVLMVPGSARHRPEKRWPAAAFGALAAQLTADGFTPLLIGDADDQDACRAIVATCPSAINLCGRTDIAQIAALARRATAAIGNDTGPMHVVAGVGCASVSLFGGASDPALIGPRGRRLLVIRHDPLADLPVARVRAAVDSVLAG